MEGNSLENYTIGLYDSAIGCTRKVLVNNT